MRKEFNVNEKAGFILDKLKTGFLLNVQTDKFNTMIIAWGHIGRVWNTDTFVVYVRQNRHTKAMLDEAKEFSVSIPLEKIDPEIFKICGMESGRNIDKVEKAKLTLVEGDKIKTSAVKECPITIECEVLYSEKQDLSKLPKEIVEKIYPQDVDGTFPRANRDAHTMYVGKIVSAYIIE